jgi:peptidoglycan-associated lipoprotein
MKKIFISVVLLFAIVAAYAQTRLELADEAYDNKQFTVALEGYQKVLLGKVKDRKEITYKVAECYRYTGQYEKAIEWYNRAKSEGYDQPNIIFQNAKILMQQGKYADAQTKLNDFLAQQPNDKDALRMLDNAKYAQNANEQPTIYTVQNITSLNTAYNDYSLVPVKSKVVFSSSRIENKEETSIYTFDGQGFSDFYESSYNIKDKIWSKPQKITALNTPFNEGSFTYCEKTKSAYFTQCNGKSGKDELCGIFESTLDDNGVWSAPKALYTTITQKVDLWHPSVTSDGQLIYFVTKMEGGAGNSDIWMLQKRGLQWEQATNLGPVINTEFDEMFPVIFQDSILYFSSEGHNGFGGLDIFYSIKRDGNWTKPANLKAPFNSSADDFHMVFTAKDRSEGYFTSNRMGGAGADDLYTFFLTPINLIVKGKVTDVDGNTPLKGAMVVLTTADGLTDTTFTNDKGEYEFKLDKNKDYKINVNNPGYFGDSKKLTTQGEMYSKEFSKANGNNYDFSIKRIPKEEIKIDDIYYDYNSFTLRDESKPNLDKLVKLLEDTPEANIQLNSHTDERGKQPYNQQLSENRAKSVVEYLVSKGIYPARLTYKGWGFAQPVVKGAKTEEEHQLNRRTTFRVLNN